MKYIRIKNSGLIEPQALHLVGASTKRNDSYKIGQFGSGNKYALAYFIRNDYEVSVYAGLNNITIETKPEIFREHWFNVLYINGERTSITTDMGKDWQFWQAIREVYCNAMDEGGYTLDFVSDITPIEGETHFYIDTKKDVLEFVANFDNYFATKKKVLFECKYGRILEKSGETANVYRKGVKCLNTNKKSIYDYDFFNITIDENRLVKYSWNVDEWLWNVIYQCDNEEIIMQILHNTSSTDFIEGCPNEFSSINASKISDAFKRCLKSVRFAPKGYAGLLKQDEIHNHVIVPTMLLESFRGYINDDNVPDKFKVTKTGAFYRELEITPLYQATLDKALYFLSEVMFEVEYEIRIAIFDNKDVLGCAHDGIIYLSEICMEKGTNEIVNTILEEFIHIKYECSDETRAFQTAMLTEFVSYMKKVNSFVL